MKKRFTPVLFILVATFTQAQHNISFQTPPEQATLFAEGIVSTGMNERDFALSPDGTELYYTISTPQSTFQSIVYMKRNKDGKWSSPEVAPFAGRFSDLEPAFSADGKELYFSSNRPLTGNTAKDFDIWVVERTAKGWSEPKNLGEPVNTAADEFYPSVARNGNLYFTAAYAQGPGKEDIYVAIRDGKGYQKPMALDTGVNSKLYEFNAFVDPDERFILFTSYGRPDDTGRGDLYISEKNEKGQWGKARNIKQINSNKLDYCPYVTPDGKALFFTSERSQLPVSFDTPVSFKTIRSAYDQPLNGVGNIFWISLSAILNNP